MASLLSGAVFGAAMLASGFYHPSIVISQLKYETWHMMEVFLTATASSAIIYTIAEKLGYVTLKPRSSSPIGLFATYDGNIIGGSMLGAGMALSGACPGTLLTQVAVGTQTGFYALGGAVLGGILWTGVVSKLVKRRKEARGIKGDMATFNQQLGLSRAFASTLFEALCASFVATTFLLAAKKAPEPKINSLTSGLLIGGAQLFSILTRRSMLGVSGSYEEVGNYFWWLLGMNPKPGHSNIVFASGLVAGAWSLAHFAPGFVGGPVQEIEPLLAMGGATLMIVGSRLAGGCTSGHGISGMSLLSVSSLVTIVSAFAAGGVVAPLVH